MSNGPPPDAKPGDLWRRLSERPRPMTEIDFPAKNADGTPIGRCKLRVLTENELSVCRAQADIAAKTILGASAPKAGEISFGYEDIYRNESIGQLLALACRDAEDPNLPVFQTPKQARTALTTDEMAVLYQAYCSWRTECGPVVSELTKDELDAWLRVLMEGGSRLPLANLSGAATSDLVMFLVSKVKEFSIATGSVGSPAGEPSMVAMQGSELVSEADVAKPE
jgi:hypothetical protein